MNPKEEREIPVMTKEVTVSETLHKSVDIETQDYNLKDMYCNEDGQAEYECDFSNTNWLKEYKDEHYTLEELLQAIPEFLEYVKPMFLAGNRAKAEFFIRECKGWIQDEIEVVL